MKKSFFSIITCTYNSEKFLQRNINSVKNQTFQDFEQIIIDGESTDNTVKIAEEFSKNDSRIKIYSHPPKASVMPLTRELRNLREGTCFLK